MEIPELLKYSNHLNVLKKLLNDFKPFFAADAFDKLIVD